MNRIIRAAGVFLTGLLFAIAPLSAEETAEWGNGSFSFAKDLTLGEDAVIRGFNLPCRSMQIWGDYYVGKGEIDPKNAPEDLSFDTEINGAQIGLNMGLGPGFLATAYYNYHKNDLERNSAAGGAPLWTNEAQTHLGGFGLRYNTGGFYFSLLGTAGLDDYELTGGEGGILNYDGWQAGGSLETGYYMRTGGLFTLKPFGNIQYSYMKADGVDYSSLSCRDEKFKADALFQTLGARIDADLSLVTVQGRFGWVHQYLDSEPIGHCWFSRTPGTYTPAQAFFEGSAGNDHLWGGAGVKISLFGTIAASLDYDILYNKYQTIHLASAGLLWNF